MSEEWKIPSLWYVYTTSSGFRGWRNVRTFAAKIKRPPPDLPQGEDSDIKGEFFDSDIKGEFFIKN